MNRTVQSSPLPWVVGAMLVGALYLAVAAWGYGVSGFPLDDGWIHQTYARNLANSGQLAFVPGVPSAGSTAPLWSLLLSLGYWLGLPFQPWTYGLGLLFLGLTGWMMARLAGLLFPRQPRLGWWVGLFCLLEWHLIWAAVSGMETVLFVWLSVWLVTQYMVWRTTTTDAPFFLIGLIAGLLILTRPEGVGLIGLIGLHMAYQHGQQVSATDSPPSIPPKGREADSPAAVGVTAGRNWRILLRRWGVIVLAVGLLLGPYMLFHLTLTGKPFPSTFYAKQAEYGLILQEFPLWWRLFGGPTMALETVQGVFRVIFIGPQILLLPGLLYALWLTIRERRTELAVIWAWWLSFLVLYAVRLPVTYQHGRYQMPVIVWVVLLGLWGTARLWGWFLPRRGRPGMFRRVGSQVMAISVGLVLLLFVGLGAQAYGRDVQFIDSEMVTVARWLNQHVAEDALIAAHDIGAIGYFAQRPLIDLAGLVTPEVIPIIRDEAALLEYMLARQADYLVTFPSWYPQLIQSERLQPQFSTALEQTAFPSPDNMVVFVINQKE